MKKELASPPAKDVIWTVEWKEEFPTHTDYHIRTVKARTAFQAWVLANPPTPFGLCKYKIEDEETVEEWAI